MSKWDVVLLADDPAGAFSPTLNASRATGGTEIHMTQLAEGLAAAGLEVMATSPIEVGDSCSEGGAHFLPLSHIASWESRVLITAGFTRPPSWLKTDRHVVLWTHDPAHNIEHLEAAGLRWSEFVCVSQWQADRFPRGWKTRVIPPIVDDWIYKLDRVPSRSTTFACVSAWWKGTQQTLEAWPQVAPEGAELLVGSPYSHPTHARAMVERVPGCHWVGLDSPRAVVETLRRVRGVFRVCTAPETFGVTDVIAQAVGCRVHLLAPNGLGGAAEALHISPWQTTDVETFASEFRKAFHAPPAIGYEIKARDFRANRIIPMWREMLDL